MAMNWNSYSLLPTPQLPQGFFCGVDSHNSTAVPAAANLLPHVDNTVTSKQQQYVAYPAHSADSAYGSPDLFAASFCTSVKNLPTLMPSRDNSNFPHVV